MLLSFDKSFAKGKRCTASQLLKEFANNRNWSRGGLNHFLQKMIYKFGYIWQLVDVA